MRVFWDEIYIQISGLLSKVDLPSVMRVDHMPSVEGLIEQKDDLPAFRFHL